MIHDDSDKNNDDTPLDPADDLATDGLAADDVIEEDDFDLDDFEDDFDDESMESNLIDVDDDDDETGDIISNSTPQEKTFLQKFFIPLVGLIVLIFAGLFFLAQNIGSSTPQRATPQIAVNDNGETDDAADPLPLEAAQSVTGLDDADGLPPMPAPIQGVPQDLVTDTPPPAPQDNEPLTPLPNDNSEEVALSNLDEVFAQPYDVRNAAPVLDIDEEFLSPESTLDSDPAEGLEAVVNTDVLDIDLETDLPVPNAAPDDIALPALDVIAPPPAPVTATAEPSIVLEPAPTLSIDPLKSDAADIAEDFQQDDKDLSDTLESLRNERDALMTETQTLAQNVEAQKTSLASLTQEFADLQQSIDAAKREQASLDDSIAAAKKAAADAAANAAKAPQNIAKPQVKEPAAKPASKPTPRPAAVQTSIAKPLAAQKPSAVAKVPRYVLRSAQPGRASVAQKGANDVRNIAVGDTLKGLGRITSIQRENGLWVVRGTKGRVSQ